MSRPGFAQLQDVIMDEDFPELDTALRRGRHIDRDDASLYALLSDAQELLEAFYRRFGCELIHKTDGYFYLLPASDKVSRRQLAPGDMLVGQALALAYLDPAAVERGGRLSGEELIAQLSAVMGSDALIAAFNPKRKRFDERVAHKNVRNRVAEAVRRLAAMGFVELIEGDNIRLRPALMRFAEPVRGLSEPAEALAKLVAQGEVALEDPEAERAEDEEDEASAQSDDDAEHADEIAAPGAEEDDAYLRALEAAAHGAGADDVPDSHEDLAGVDDDAEAVDDVAAAEEGDAYVRALEAAALRARIDHSSDSDDDPDEAPRHSEARALRADDVEVTAVVPRGAAESPDEEVEPATEDPPPRAAGDEDSE